MGIPDTLPTWAVVAVVSGLVVAVVALWFAYRGEVKEHTKSWKNWYKDLGGKHGK